MGLIQRRLVKLQEKVEALKKFPRYVLSIGWQTTIFVFSQIFSCWPALHRPDMEKTAGKYDMDTGGWRSVHYGAFTSEHVVLGALDLSLLHLPESQIFSQEHLVTFISQKIKPPVESEYSAIGKKGLAINWVILERLQIIQTQFLLEVHLLLSVAQIMTQTQEWGHGLLCFKTFDFSLDIGCRR